MVGRRRFDVAARNATLTGAEIRRQQTAGISVEEFADVFGVPPSTLRRMTEGVHPGPIPMLYEIALFYFEHHAVELRRRPPPAHWPVNRRGYRLDPYLSGEEVASRLHAIAWSIPDFARFAGLTDRSMRDVFKGRKDGRLTVLFGSALELVEYHPLAMQALPRVLTAARQSRARQEALLHITT